MIDKVMEFIDTNRMIIAGDDIIAAVSGGPDSMCLLHILIKLRERYNFKLCAAHINHCLRGEEADSDEEYVRRYCEHIGVPFYSKRIDLQKYAGIRGISSEMAGREVRYAFFTELREKLGANKIALAHNANDQAETVLMRIMRGTGLEGLRGIQPVREGIYIRPVLILTRDEIENYCLKYELNPRIDRTNMENIYNRNKIRLELIPYIQSNFNPDIISTLNRFALLLDKDNDFLEKYAEEKYSIYCKNEGSRILIAGNAFSEKDAIITRIIRKAVNELLGSIYNFESVHFYDIINLSRLGTGRRLTLPGKLFAENVYGNIHLYIKTHKKDEKKIIDRILASKIEEAEKLRCGIRIDIPERKLQVELKLTDRENKLYFKKDGLTKYFDYDKIKGDIILRTRREGDRFIPLGMRGSKKIKDLFMDLKIPKEKRDGIPLLCFGDDIAWIVGYRVSDSFKVDPVSNNILEVKIKGEFIQDEK